MIIDQNLIRLEHVRLRCARLTDMQCERRLASSREARVHLIDRKLERLQPQLITASDRVHQRSNRGGVGR